ncbi:hypothetical protein AB4Z22_03405 [Paenibacillus sp. TAF58]
MYLLKSKTVFDEIYAKRTDYDLEEIINKVLSALFHQYKHESLKQQFIAFLGISEHMITGDVTDYSIKEMDKDLANFMLWVRKRSIKKEKTMGLKQKQQPRLKKEI